MEIRKREWVEIEFDKAGQLVFYSLYGSFMDKPKISKELYTLNLQKAEPLAKKQFQQWDFPSNEQQRFVSMYGIEEVYIRNDLSGTFPLELSHNIRKVDYLLEWAEPVHKQFKRKPVKFTEELTIEQALVCEPHPETFPITDDDVQMCVKEVRVFLQTVTQTIQASGE